MTDIRRQPVQEGEQQAFAALLQFVQRARGLDCGQYKKKFMRRRVAMRMRARGVDTYGAYLSLLRSDATELDRLLAALSINISRFFRDGPVFDVLRHAVLPPLIAERRQSGQHRLCLWSAGCAGGEEPYSLVMLLKDLLGRDFERWEVTVHATDIEERALAHARRGIYRAGSFRDPQAGYVKRYFSRRGDRFVLQAEIRRAVTFQRHDLMVPGPVSDCDLILCRNVLIYFARRHQSRLLRRLIAALRPGGHLVLGMVEMLPPDVVASGRLEAVDRRLRIYRKRVKEAQ